MRIAATATLFGCAVAAVTAQNQRPPAATFRATTRLVEVSVVARDRDGRPMQGLTAADFRITEDGKPQKIELFTVQDDLDQASAARGSSRATAAAPAVPAAERVDFSNVREERPRNVTVILIDRVNSVDIDQKAGRDSLVKFLSQVRREDIVALYVLENSSIRVLHDFTADTSSLLASLARYRVRANGDPEGNNLVGPDTGDPATGNPALDNFLQDSEALLRGQVIRNRVEVMAAAMETIARHLSGIQGRKNMIWITSGFPVVGQEYGRPVIYSGETGRAMRALSDANIAVYPLDDRRIPGYLPLPVTGVSPLAPRRGSPPPPVNAPSGFQMASNQDGMLSLADATGGRAFLHTNDLVDAFRRAADDARLTYVLGYYPAQTKWDDRFHRIHVAVSRPGVSVRYRSGYVATQTPAKVALADIARNPLEATGLRLSAHLARIAPAAGARGLQPSGTDELQITVRLEPTSVTLTKTAATWDGAVEILIAHTWANGKLVKTFERTLQLQFPDAERAQIQEEGFTLTRTIAPEAGANGLHIVVRDTATGATGSINIPLTP